MAKKKNPTISDLLPQFLEERNGLTSYSDYRRIEQNCRNWILPYLGKIKVKELCDGDVQHLLNTACRMGRKKKTIKGIKGTLSLFLKYCRRYKLTSYRFDDVEIPKSAKSVGKTILNQSDIQKLFSSDLTLYKNEIIVDPFIHYYRLMLLTGCRPSELLGLQFADVDLDKRCISIKRAINIHKEVTQGKNQNALRTVPLCDLALEEAKAQMIQAEKAVSVPHSKYLFTADERKILTYWRRYLAYNDMTKITLYELRHTFVSIAKSLPEGEVKSLVGHSQNMDTYGVYSHAFEGDFSRVSNDIQICFNNILNSRLN